MRIAIGIWFGLMALVSAAGLEFKETTKELHAPADVNTVSADFEFTNRSDKTVTVTKYESTCSCMSVTIKGGKLSYAPGESGVIRAQFDMGNFSGEIDKVVLLWLDGKGEPQSIRVTMKHDKPIRVTAVKSTSEAFKLELKTIEEGKTYDVNVTPLNMKSPGLAVIRIETDCDIDKHRIQQAFAVVRKP
jgi:hypothetical protein